MQGGDVVDPLHQLVGGARHGRDHDRDLVAAGDFGFHLARDIPDAVGVADRGTAELENDARHGPARKRGIDTGGTIWVKGGHGR